MTGETVMGTIKNVERDDYPAAYQDFRIGDIEALLGGSLTEGLNACVECCDRHAQLGGAALNWEGEDGSHAEVSFAELRQSAARFANFLRSIGVGAGDVVAGLLPRRPDLLTVILGTWRIGAVYQPLFTAFGPKAIETRLRTSGAKLVVTDQANRSKLDSVTGTAFQVIVTDGGASGGREGDSNLKVELARQSDAFTPVMRSGEDAFLMMSTSGSTGAPKCVAVPLRALLSFAVYMRDAIGLREGDRFWNFADPGWAYGLYYGVIGPLLLGHATLFYDGSFSVESTYRIIRNHGITNLAGAPTAFRLMIAAGPEAALDIKGRLRVVSSAGEPLNTEVARWFDQHIGAPICDHYGQTEVGMVVCNHHGAQHAVPAGSTGMPMPGFRLAVLDDQGAELPPGRPGVLAVDIARSPLYWFGGYWQQATPAVEGGYFCTGDIMERAGDGSFSFVGRADDVITSAGYRIGPFDVESVLIEHAAVVESAVIGKPDPERTEIVKAFVVLSKAAKPSSSLIEELQQYVKKRLSSHAYPREIEFVEALPKTPSGKIQRYLLRNQEIAKASGT